MITPIHLQPDPTSPAMPLSMASQGQTVTITQVNGGQMLRQRLLDLGLNLGARVHIVKNEMTGPLILAVKEDGRLALGRGMTQHVLVTPAPVVVNGD
ncbi:MAG: ferrous iron transport protein A [Anaerolineae bacterium]